MTKRKSKGVPLSIETDSQRMQAAIKWALNENLPLKRPAPNQIVIGPFSFYPDSGTFNEHGNSKSKQRGFAAFKMAIRAWQDEESAEWR